MVPLSQHQQQQQYTLGFLKPDVMDRKKELMQLVKSKTLWTVAFEKELCLSLEEAQLLYPQHEIASWLSSRSVYIFILNGPNVVKNWCKFAGPKNSVKAKQISPQSLRAIYGLDDIRNACHASISDKEAQRDLTWLQNLVPGHQLLFPLDPGSASSPKQRHHGASIKSSSTNVAASSLSNGNPPAAPSINYLKTTSNSSSFPSETKKKPLEKKLMVNTRPSPSIATSSVAPKPIAKNDRTSQCQQPTTLLSVKTAGHNNNTKRSTNVAQGFLKSTSSGCVSPKQQRQKLNKLQAQPMDTTKAATPMHDNKIQQQHDTIEALPNSPLQHDDTINKSTELENDMVASPLALSSINDILDSIHHDTGGHQPNQDQYATMASLSSHSIGSTSTGTADSDHDDNEVMTSPANDNIRIISPTSPIGSLRPTASSDVGSLRHEFEALCQSKVLTRAPSIPKTTHLPSRIKDLKPKDPSGSRVKSMVAFFMDENLHKWEF